MVRRLSSWRWLVGVALFVHVAFSVQRMAFKSVPRRLAEIERWQRLGPVRYHLDRSPASVDTVEFLARHTRPDAVVLFRGHRGLMEHAAALLWPRVLYDETAAPGGVTTLIGRPVARAALPGRGEGTLVLAGGHGDEPLRLELR